MVKDPEFEKPKLASVENMDHGVKIIKSIHLHWAAEMLYYFMLSNLSFKWVRWNAIQTNSWILSNSLAGIWFELTTVRVAAQNLNHWTILSNQSQDQSDQEMWAHEALSRTVFDRVLD